MARGLGGVRVTIEGPDQRGSVTVRSEQLERISEIQPARFGLELVLEEEGAETRIAVVVGAIGERERPGILFTAQAVVAPGPDNRPLS